MGKTRLQGPADFVIEILSDTTRDYDLTTKKSKYVEAGVSEIWFIDPDRREIRLVRAGQETTVRTGRVESTMVQGFWIEADPLWEERLPRAYDCLKKLLGE